MQKTKNNTLNYKFTQNLTKPTVFSRKKEKHLIRNFSDDFCKTAFFDTNNYLSGI